MYIDRITFFNNFQTVNRRPYMKSESLEIPIILITLL